MKAIETTTRTAYDQDTKQKYQIRMPKAKVVRQAILELDYPPEGLSPTEVKEILEEEWELSDEQKTAVSPTKQHIFYHVVHSGLDTLFHKKKKLDREDGKYWPRG